MLTIVLRLLHVVAGAIWVGAAFVVAFFLFPAIRASGPAGGVVMRQVAAVRKLPIVLTIMGWIAVLSGFALYARDSMGDSNGWSASPAAITFGAGGLLSLIAILLGTFWNRPVAAKMAAVGAALQGAGSPPPTHLVSEMARLQESFAKASKIVAVLLIGTAIAMSVARYL